MKSQLNIAICDDFQKDRDLLKEYIADILGEKEIDAQIDLYSCGEDLWATDSNKYDLIILEVFVDGINGMEIAREVICKNKNAKIAFCSASADFAVESYEVGAFYYLLKPVSRGKLGTMIERLLETFISYQSIEINIGRKKKRIYISDILWVESSGKKCVFHTKQGDVEAISQFSQIYEELAVYDFIRPIRYAIVSLRQIANIRNDITLANGDIVHISRNMRQSVEKAFADYNWKTMMKKGGNKL